MKRGQDGFTLIESLLVFSIFLIISSVTAFSLKPQYFMVNDNAFITQLQADLLYGQQFAISHQCEVFVRLTETDGYSIYYRYDLQPLVNRPYLEDMKVFGGTLPLSFKFLPDGNVAQFGYFEINTCSKKYLFTVLIGKGRFYVLEE
jgi:competence protein ComGD